MSAEVERRCGACSDIERLFAACSDIERLFAARGDHAYGEGVSQREHALQCAMLAQQRGEPAALVLAALLHDIGHLLHADADAALADGIDDRHEALGAQWLAQRFVSALWQPVALHVQAKRYLCAREPGYAQALSDASQRSLALQGGPMTAAEANRFETLRHADAALRLRRFDELAKVPGLATPPLAHFLALAEGCAIELPSL